MTGDELGEFFYVGPEEWKAPSVSGQVPTVKIVNRGEFQERIFLIDLGTDVQDPDRISTLHMLFKVIPIDVIESENRNGVVVSGAFDRGWAAFAAESIQKSLDLKCEKRFQDFSPTHESHRSENVSHLVLERSTGRKNTDRVDTSGVSPRKESIQWAGIEEVIGVEGEDVLFHVCSEENFFTVSGY